MMLNHNSMLLPLINSFNPRADPYNLIHIAILFVLAVADSHRYSSLLPLIIQPQHPTLSFPWSLQTTCHHSIFAPSDSQFGYIAMLPFHPSLQFPFFAKEHSGKPVFPCPYSLRIHYKDVRCRRKDRVKAYWFWLLQVEQTDQCIQEGTNSPCRLTQRSWSASVSTLHQPKSRVLPLWSPFILRESPCLRGTRLEHGSLW